MATLAAKGPVLAPDLPGSGDSDALRSGRHDIDRHAAAVIDVLDRSGLDRVLLYGKGSGAALAVRLAARHPQRIVALVLDDLPSPTAAEQRDYARHYTPPIEPVWDGSHLYRTWLMLRDQLIYRPWYRRTRQAIRRIDMELTPEELQAWVLEVLKSPRHYGDAFQAAIRYRAERDFRRLRMPVLRLRDAGTWPRWLRRVGTT